MIREKYQERSVLEKLGIKPGSAVAFADTQAVDEIAPELLRDVMAHIGRSLATEDEALDVVLAAIDGTSAAVELLSLWRKRLQPHGGIWLLTTKRGQPGYVDQRALIAAGQQAGLVDNKICSVSATVSAMRFVIRKRDR